MYFLCLLVYIIHSSLGICQIYVKQIAFWWFCVTIPIFSRCKTFWKIHFYLQCQHTNVTNQMWFGETSKPKLCLHFPKEPGCALIYSAVPSSFRFSRRSHWSNRWKLFCILLHLVWPSSTCTSRLRGSSPRLLHRWLCLFLFSRSTLQNKTWRPGSTTKHQQARHGRQETAPQVAPFPFSISQAFVCARWRVNPALCVSVKKSVMLDNWRVQIPRFVQKEFHCYNAAGNRGKTRRRKPRVNWNFVTLLIFLFESSWKHSFCFSLCSNKEKNESKKSMDYGAGTLICCFSLFLNSQQTRD